MAIEIDGLPVYLLKMVIFHGYVTNNQMVGKSLRALVTFFSVQQLIITIPQRFVALPTFQVSIHKHDWLCTHY